MHVESTMELGSKRYLSIRGRIRVKSKELLSQNGEEAHMARGQKMRVRLERSVD